MSAYDSTELAAARARARAAAPRLVSCPFLASEWLEGGSLLAAAAAGGTDGRSARVVVGGRARPSSFLSSKAFSAVPLLSAAASAVPVRGGARLVACVWGRSGVPPAAAPGATTPRRSPRQPRPHGAPWHR